MRFEDYLEEVADGDGGEAPQEEGAEAGAALVVEAQQEQGERPDEDEHGEGAHGCGAGGHGDDAELEAYHEIHHGAGWRGDLDALTDEANKKHQLLKDIVNSFNRDCSNGMIDYFDRDFYDSYYFKVVD